MESVRNEDNERVRYLDIVKIFSFYGIVVLHNASDGPVHFFLATVCVACFILLSGYFVSVKRYSGKASFRTVLGRIKPLLLCYGITAFIESLIFCLVFGVPVFDVFFTFLTGAGADGIGFNTVFNAGALWFILALCWCEIFFLLSVKIVNFVKHRFGRYTVIFEIVFFIIVPVLLTFFKIPLKYSILGFASGLACFPIFYFGTLCRRFNVFRYCNIVLFLISIVGFFVIFWLFLSSDLMDLLRISLVNFHYGSYLLSFLCACFLALGLITIVHFLDDKIGKKFNIVSCLLSCFGRYTLFMLCLHAILLRVYDLFQRIMFSCVSYIDDIILRSFILAFLEILLYCFIIYEISRYKFFKFLFGQGDVREILNFRKERKVVQDGK